jgi:hypothetical protein
MDKLIDDDFKKFCEKRIEKGEADSIIFKFSKALNYKLPLISLSHHTVHINIDDNNTKHE